jgi:hypothetical protein
MSRLMERRSLLLAPWAARALAAPAAEDWQQWSDKKVLQILTDSPWARRRKVRLEWFRREPAPPRAEDIPGATGPNMRRPDGGNPIGGIGVPRTSLPLEADLIVRWVSALPVRQARALYLYRAQANTVRTLAELFEEEAGDAVLEIHGLPAQIAHKGAGSVELVGMQGVRVIPGRGRAVPPLKARADLTGLSLDLYLHFERAALASPRGDLEVQADLQITRFKERFRTREMFYAGRFEI